MRFAQSRSGIRFYFNQSSNGINRYSRPAVNHQPGFRRENSQSSPHIQIIRNNIVSRKPVFQIFMICFCHFSICFGNLFFDMFEIIFRSYKFLVDKKRYYLIPRIFNLRFQSILSFRESSNFVIF